ncbi:MAG: NAD-dependent epimerase/dehydratase family protein, partial [Nitrospirota bacterium]
CNSYNGQFDTDFISLMPTNLYGPGDNFDLESSHVLPALIRKFHEAKLEDAPQVIVWGTGAPMREFLYVDDLAEAAVHMMDNYSAKKIGEFVNIGTGEDVSIRGLAEIIRDAVGFEGEIIFDREKPDGMPRKLLDVSRARTLGWSYNIPLNAGIIKTYEWYRSNNGAV